LEEEGSEEDSTEDEDDLDEGDEEHRLFVVRLYPRLTRLIPH
jgi:hypothetical protein